MSTIFISYRRTDSKHATSRVYDRLRLEFGKGSVFKDVDSIPIGTDFRAVLKKVLGQCRVALVMIGPDWVTTPGDDGNPRLMNPTDYVRLELEATLARGIPVVPVLLDGAPMPRPEQLPESLRRICFRHAVTVGEDPHFDDDVARLIRGVQNLLDPRPVEPPSEPTASRATGRKEPRDAPGGDRETTPAERAARFFSIVARVALVLQAIYCGLGAVVWSYTYLSKAQLSEGERVIAPFFLCVGLTSVLNCVFGWRQPSRRVIPVAFLSWALLIGLIVVGGERPSLAAVVCVILLQFALTAWFVLTRPAVRTDDAHG